MRWLLVILLLLPLLALSQTYSAPVRLDSLQISCYQQLRVDTAGTAYMTDQMVRFALNRGLAQVCIDFPALEKMDTVVVDKDAAGGALASDFLRIEKVFKMIGDTLWIPVQYVTLDSLYAVAPTADGYMHDKANIADPRYCYTFAQRLLFHPKDAKASTDADTFLVLYYAADDRLLDDTSTVAILPEYIPALIDYACADLAALKRDLQESMFYRSRYREIKQGRIPREAELKE